jgi:hypothetical protein
MLLNLDPGVNPPRSGPRISETRKEGRTSTIAAVVECFVCPLADQYGVLVQWRWLAGSGGSSGAL